MGMKARMHWLVTVAALTVMVAGCGGAETAPDDTTPTAGDGSATTIPTAGTAPGTSTTAAPALPIPTTAAPAPTTVPPSDLTTPTAAPPDKPEPVAAPTLPPLGVPPGVDPTRNPQVAFAIADLADRLGVAERDIAVVGWRDVVWPDGSIGCPQPGMSYTQALVDGSQIVLEVDGRLFDYHAAGTRDPFLCTRTVTTPPPAD